MNHFEACVLAGVIVFGFYWILARYAGGDPEDKNGR
jgi:hypothetical protein